MERFRTLAGRGVHVLAIRAQLAQAALGQFGSFNNVIANLRRRCLEGPVSFYETDLL